MDWSTSVLQNVRRHDLRPRARLRPRGLHPRGGRPGRRPVERDRLRSLRSGRARRPDGAIRPPWPGGGERPPREGYYTGGNIIGAAEEPPPGLRRGLGLAPPAYNPHSGTDWAHLVPDPRDRPRGGGPAPSLAFPLVPHSAAIDAPWNNPAPTAPSPVCAGRKEGFGASPSDHSLQLIKVFLLIVIVVLLAMTLMAAAGSLAPSSVAAEAVSASARP